MSFLRKTLSAMVSASLVLTLALTTTAVAGTSQFTDISGHWAESYIIDLAEQDVISTTEADGTTPKTMFFPNNSLTRAELTKLAIEAFYGDSVDDLALAFADSANPSFTDVPADAWFFKYVEIAKGLDIVQGFADGTFGPTLPITRSATLKVILLTGDIETMLEPAPPFVDVATGEWYYEFVATGYNNCIVSGTTPTTFTPNGNVTRAESTKILANSLDAANGIDVCAAEGDDDDTIGDDDDDTGPTPTPGPAGTLEVSLSSTNPEGVSVPKNGSNVPFLAIDLTNDGEQDIEVTGVTVSHGGLGDENDIDDVKIFDGIDQKGSDRPFSNDEEIAALNLAAEPVVVEAGKTKTIVVAADMSATDSGGEHVFTIADSADITAVAAETGEAVDIGGDFPISGETMSVANISVGSLAFDFQTVADTSVEVGETEVELARVKLTAGTAEDVLLQAMTLEFNGIDDGDIANIYAEFQGERISNLTELIQDEKVTFDFTEGADEGWILEDGDNRTIRIKGDIIAGVDDTVTPDFDKVESDVIATGLTYGFGIGLSDDTNASTITIEGGDITFAFDSSSRDVAQDTDDVEFGILTIQNMGEAVELKENLKLLGSADMDDGLAADNIDVTDIKLVNVETGSTFMGPEDLNVDGDVVFSDEVILESGETLTLSLQGDIGTSSTVNAGETYNFALEMVSVSVEGVESNKGTASYDIKPSGNPSTKIYTVASPTLTITAKTLGNDTVVADANNITVWQGSVRANEVEDLYIRELTFTNTGTATSSDIDDYSIFKKEGNVLTPVETGAEATATAGVSFTSLDEDGGTNGILLPAGDEFTLVVTANIASAPTLNRTIILGLPIDTTAGVAVAPVVEDEDGDTANISNADLSTVASGGTVTIATSGTFAVSVDNNKTDTQIVPAGLTDIPVGVFKLEATNESVEVKKLAVKINEVATDATLDPAAPVINNAEVANDSDAIDTVALFYYDDGTAVKKTSGQAAEVSSINADNIALFQDLDLIAEDSADQLIEVRVNVREMDDQDANALARSGHAFNAELLFNDTSEVRGVDSGSILTAVSTGVTETATNAEGLAANVVVEGTFLATEYAVGDYVIISAGLATEEIAVVEAVVNNTSITVDLTQNHLAGATVANLNTSASDTLYVVNNKVVAEETASQPSGTLTTGTKKELLKFDVDFTGDTADEPFIHAVVVKIEGTGNAGLGITDLDNTDADPGVAYLYNGDNEIVGCDEGTTALGGIETLTIVVGDNTDCPLETLSTDIDAAAGAADVDGDPVAASGETYTIKADLLTDGADDAVSATVEINASAPGTDDIVWIDGGSTGTDGLAIQWIDLGPASSVTQIQNTLSN